MKRSNLASRYRLMALLFVMGITLFGCGSDGDDETPAGLIGPAGGVVDGPNGESLSIPAGALATELTIRIATVDGPSGTQYETVLPAAFFIELLPAGTTLAKPAELRLPYSMDAALVLLTDDLEATCSGLRDESRMQAWTPSDGASPWSYLDSQVNEVDDVLTTLISTFGIYGPGLPCQEPNLGRPELNAPDELDFEVVRVGQTGQVQLVIGNTGTTNLDLESLDITLSANAFFLEEAFAATQVPPDGNTTVIINFNPGAAELYSGEARLVSNDPDQPQWTIALYGRGSEGGQASVNPDALDFGEVELGTSRDLSLNFTNIASSGSLSGLSAEVAVDGPFSLVDWNWPVVLAPSENLALSVRFTPTAAEYFSEDLILETDDPLQPRLEVGLEGTGTTE